MVRSIAIASVLVALVAGCATSREAAAPRFDHTVTADSVLALVQEQGLVVTGHYSATPNPRLQPRPDLEVVELATLRGRLYLYTFESPQAARSNARLQDFGSTCRTRPGAPSITTRFDPTSVCDEVPVFQQGRLVVAYVGEETLLETLLRPAFGPPVQS